MTSLACAPIQFETRKLLLDGLALLIVLDTIVWMIVAHWPHTKRLEGVPLTSVRRHQERMDRPVGITLTTRASATLERSERIHISLAGNCRRWRSPLRLGKCANLP